MAKIAFRHVYSNTKSLELKVKDVTLTEIAIYIVHMVSPAQNFVLSVGETSCSSSHEAGSRSQELRKEVPLTTLEPFGKGTDSETTN